GAHIDWAGIVPPVPDPHLSSRRTANRPRSHRHQHGRTRDARITAGWYANLSTKPQSPLSATTTNRADLRPKVPTYGRPLSDGRAQAFVETLHGRVIACV